MLRLALAFALIAVAFDAAAALIARAAAFNYGQFALLSLVLYAAFGVFAGQRLRWQRALIALAIAAVVDVTIGSYVATSLSAWVGQTARDREAVGTAALTGILSLVVGAAGVAAGSRAAR